MSADIPRSGLSSESTSSSYHSQMPHDVGMFGMEFVPAQSQFICQAGPQQTSVLSRRTDIEVGTDIGHKAIGNEMPQQLAPWAVPSTNEPSRERMTSADSSYFVQQNLSNTFPGSLPNVSLQSVFPISSGTVFGGSAATSSMHSSFLGLPRGQEMLTTASGPMRLPQTQPTEQHLYDQKEFALGKLQTYPPVVSISDSVFTQGLPHQPAQLVDMFPSAQPRALTLLSQSDPARLASSRLHLDQQPIRLFVPPPILPPQPPLVLTSGQPSNLPVAVGAPLAVVQETPSVELQPVPMLPMPAHFMVEPPRMSMLQHQVPQPNLVTEQSAIRLQSSPMTGLIPSFLSDPPHQRGLTPHVILHEAPAGPPSVVPMPSLVQVGEMMLDQQRAVSDTAPGQIRLPVMPKSLFECHPVGRQLPAQTLAQEFPEVHPTCDTQNNAELRLQGTSDQLSAPLRSEYPGSHMLPNRTREMMPQSDRQFGMSSKPLAAPGQMLEEFQRLPVPQTRHLLGEPSRESLRSGMSPLRMSDPRSQELGKVPNIGLPVMEHDDLSSDVALGRLEQHGPSLSGSTFSSRLPAPAVVMASSQSIGSRLPDDRFQSKFWHRDFADEEESDSLLDHPVDRVRSSSHFSEFAPSSMNVPYQRLTSNRTRVPSLLDENLLEMSSQSGSSNMNIHASLPTRRWNDRSGSEMRTVGELRETLRQHDDVNRRRTFRHSSTEDSAPWSSYEPHRKFMRFDDDAASEPKDLLHASDSKSDSHDDKDAASSSLDSASAPVSEASASVLTTELS